LAVIIIRLVFVLIPIHRGFIIIGIVVVPLLVILAERAIEIVIPTQIRIPLIAREKIIGVVRLLVRTVQVGPVLVGASGMQRLSTNEVGGTSDGAVTVSTIFTLMVHEKTPERGVRLIRAFYSIGRVCQEIYRNLREYFRWANPVPKGKNGRPRFSK
jgi:hypothetical protein